MTQTLNTLLTDIRSGRISRADAIERFKALGVKPRDMNLEVATGLVRSKIYSYGEDLLKDHLLLGEQFLMGVAHWSLAIEELAQHVPSSSLRLTEAVFVDAVKLDPGKKVCIDLYLREDKRGLVFETRYEKSPGTSVTAARGRVAEGDAEFFKWKGDPKDRMADVLASVEGDRFYGDPEQSCYGPSLLSLRRVHRLVEGEGVLAEIELAPTMQREAESWFCHPAWLDALHVSSAFAASWDDPVGSHWIPFAAESVRVAGSLADRASQRMFAWVRLEKETTETKKFNCALYTQTGQPLIELRGFSTKRVPSREALLGQTGAAKTAPKATTEAPQDTPKPQRNLTQTQYGADAEPFPLQDLISDYLVHIAADRLKVSKNEIHTRRNFMEMGLDSIAITGVSEVIGEQIGIDILPTAFFENQNIEELCAYFVEEFPEEFSAHFRNEGVGIEGSVDAQELPSAAPKPKFADESAANIPVGGNNRQDIAIIGMDGRLAGSPNLNRFWQHLLDDSDLMSEIPLSHWDYRPWFDAERTAENKTYCKWGSFLEDIDCFDPQFFGIAPSQAPWMDPQLRMLLEVVYGTIEDAGCANTIRGSRTGVYTGVCFREYWDEIVRKRVPLKSGFEAYSSGLSTLATVISYTFDLQAASVPIDNACASSLTALHLACQALRMGECDQAFVAGINLLLSPLHYVFFSRIQALSPTGRCHTFDKRADGYTPGEGIVAVLLKPLDKAIADGDQIHAVIKSTAVNHAGRSNNPTSPRPELQTRLVLDSWKNAGIDPETISYMECHGTGTALGDPIEINALKKAFAKHTDKTNFCAIGSAKAHIGHLEGAAGLAGLLKVVLSMKHRTIPHMPGFKELNPVIRIDNSPFYINRETRDWNNLAQDNGEQIPLRAGVSSFGIGGNNAHVVLEEYRAPFAQVANDQALRPAENAMPVSVPLSARTPDRLLAVAQRLLEFVRQYPQTDLADLAFTLQTGREAMEERLGFVVSSLPELEQGLQAYLANPDSARVRARVGDHRETLAGFVAPLGSKATSERLLAAGDPETLLLWWSKGLNLDWRALYTVQRPALISLPTYPFARESYWMPESKEETLQSAYVPAELPAPAELVNSAYYPSWAMVADEGPVPGVTAGSKSSVKTVLILHGESTFGFDTTLADAHPEARTIRIQLVSASTHPLDEDHWLCGLDDPDGLATCLADLPNIDRVFFLALDARPTQSLPPELAAAAPIELQLARLANLLRRKLSPSASLDVFVVGLDRFRIDGGACNAYSGGLGGLAYSIAQSEHRFKLRNADLSREELKTGESRALLARRLIAQVASDRGAPIKYWSGCRYQQVFLPLDWQEAKHTSGLRRGGLYVLLGGSGAVGGLITRYLMDICDAQVAWLGRRPINDAGLQSALKAQAFKPIYLQADATDLESLQRALATLKKTHGEVHGAIYAGLPDQAMGSLFEVSESEFLRTLRVKTLGSLNFYLALQDQSLDFLCYFSSAQAFAFSGAARMSAYASGIGFSDALVRALQSTAAFPVGAINWGLWQSSPAGLLASQSEMAGLSDAEGWAYFDRFIAILSQRRVYQAICMKVSEPVRAMMQPLEEECITLAGSLHPVTPEALWRGDVESEAQLKAVMEGGALDDFETQLIKLLWVELQAMGALPTAEPADSEALRRSAGILDKFRPWWQESLRVLGQAGYLRLDQGLVCRVTERDIGTIEGIRSQWEHNKQDFLVNRDLRTAVSLADDCLRLLPQILTGKKLVTDVLFPDGSMSRIEGLYKDNVRSDYYNTVMAQIVVAYLRHRLAADPSAKLRILEIGAGTGGTTSTILSALHNYRDQITEYCFTDVSKAFLNNAQRRYGAEFPFLTTRLWDVEQPLEKQGIVAGHYDVVLATNVLHATRSIRNTLRNTKATLANNGLLLLNEISRKEVFQSVVFGLIDGWSLSEDDQLRIPGSPGLYPETWQWLLEETGFREVCFPVESAHAYGNQIILATSDGLIHQPRRAFVQPVAESPASAVNVVQAGLSDRQHAIRKASDEPAYSTVAQPPVAPDAGERIQHLVLSSLAEVLSVPVESIQNDVAFSDYGVDSILGVKFINAIGEGLAASINTAILFDYSSVERLSGYLVETYGASLTLPASNNLDMNASEAHTLGKPKSAPFPPGQLTVTPKPAFKPSVSEHTGSLTEIAVIGLSSQCPDAENAYAFWDNLIAGKCSIKELSEPYLDQQIAFDTRKQRGKTYCKWGGALRSRDSFDPRFFNITPAEAESMSPHQRLVLQEAWRSLEDAGYNPRRLSGSRTGIYIGAEPTRYVHDSFTGASDAIVASRFSYFLDLQGPAFVVNTGCSSSGVALHLACESLRNNETDLMLAGGVYACLDQEGLVSLSQAGMLSSSGCCSPFDASADGTLLAEAVGIVVLKRLDDALRDEDPIYGVIQASGMNQDGASNGITAPSGAAQQRLIKSVYDKFRIDPATISYVEAHGTGTELGDPVEANALVRAFAGAGADQGKHCAVGTAKANIGHTAAASGVLGLIKILMSLIHRTLPGLPNFDRLNPRIEFGNSPFYPIRQNREWQPRDGMPRVAALNSFGHSGTNVHIVVREQVNSPSVALLGAPKQGMVVVPISARTQDSLKQGAERLLRWVERMDHAQTSFSLQDLAYTLQLGRDAMRCRLAIVCEDKASLMSALQRFITDSSGVVGEVSDKGPSLLFDSEEDTRELLAKWTAQGKLNKIARCWMQGIPVDWTALYPGNRPRRIHLPTYAFAQERYWGPSYRRNNEGGRVDHVSEKQASVQAEPASVFFEEYWNACADTDVCEDTGKVEFPLKRLLCLLVDPVRRRQLAEAFLHAHPTLELVFVTDEVELENLLAGTDAIADLRALEDPQRLAQAAHLQALIKAIAASPQRPKRLLIAGSTDDELQRCQLDAWIGMARSLPLVLPQLETGVIGRDGQPDMALWMSSIYQALSVKQLPSVLYRDGRATVCRLRPVSLDAGESVLKAGGSYLITGGCGGLGYQIAEHLARNYGAKLALLGRTPMDTCIREKLDKLHRLGGQACYVQADVCDANQLRAAVQEARKHVGAFHGLVHAAGTQGSQTILEKTAADLQVVMDIKIKGCLLLDEVLREDPLDLVCYFSSSAAILGDFGACDYAVGNRFQNAYAQARNVRWAQGLCSGRAVVINWPLWHADGMSVDQADLYLKSSGQQALDIDTGVALFDRLLAQPRAQHLVLNGDPQRIYGFLRRKGLLEAAINAEQPASGDLQTGGEVLLKALLQDLRESVVRLLKIDRSELLADTNLVDFGFDSISLTEFARELSERYRITLAPSVFFGYSTLKQLSNYLLAEHTQATGWYLSGRAPQAANVFLVPEPPKGTIQDLQQVQTQAPSQTLSLSEPIAVIGMSGRFPQARDADEMWSLLIEGRSAVQEIPAERFDWRAIAGSGPGMSNSRWCGSVPGVAEFDPLFFEIAPRDAQHLDPRQRLLLQEAWNALENAGYGPAQLAQSTVGTFVGVEEGDYQRVAAAEDIASNHTGVLASRLAYFLDLHGPTLAINTACSSSLVAVHQACMSLRNGECDTALAAGVNLLLAPDIYVALAKAGMLSDEGKCFAFDRRANGMVPAEAVAVVVLKPWSRALADGDPIHALIRGSRINYDGKTNGITAPSGLSQAELIKDVYRQTGIAPDAVDYIVTHGTGTRLGDAVEINALNDAFKASTSKQGYCALTSTKSNFGHSFAASGLVSLIALIQSLRHETIPASLHCEHENDFIRWQESPFFVNKQNRPWPARPGQVRIGGVSAFGMSGTNAHLIVSDPPAIDPEPVGAQRPVHLLVLSAKTEQALLARAQQMHAALAANDYSLEALAHTLAQGRHHLRHRLALIVANREEALHVFERHAAEQPSSSPVYRCGLVPVDFSPEPSSIAKGADLIRSLNDLREKPEQYSEILATLGELYCRGYELPWVNMFDASPPRRLCLPGYPFSRQTYWSQRAGATAPAAASPQATEIDFVHPLLQRNNSDPSRQSFISRLTSERDCLRDHQVAGRAIVPAVAYLEMARAAIQEVAPEAAISLRRVVWLQALALQDTPVEVQLDLSRHSAELIRFQFRDAENCLYCQGEAELGATVGRPRLDIAALKAQCQTAQIGAQRFYTSFRSMSINYGSTHQGLESVYVGDAQALARLSLPSEYLNSDGVYVLHPGILDSALQAAVALHFGADTPWPGESGADSNLSPQIPFALESLEALGNSPATCWAWIRPAPDQEISQKLDIDCCDDQGVVFARLRGLSTRSLSSRNKHAVIRFSGGEYFLEDHGGMLPGAVHLELVRAACEQEVYGLREVHWKRPIWVDAEGLELRIELGQRGGQHSFEIKVEDEVYSQGLLCFEPAQKPAAVALTPIRERCVHYLDHKACEQRLGGQHGPRLFSVRELRYSDDEALALLESPSTEEHGFQVDPAMLNGVLLSSVLFSLVDDSKASVPFPFGIDRVDYFAPLPERVYAYLRRSADDRIGAIHRHDISLIDDQGRVAITFSGLATVSGKAVSEMLYATPYWRAEPRSKLDARQTGTGADQAAGEPLFMLTTRDSAFENRLRERWPGATVECVSQPIAKAGEHWIKAVQDNFVRVYRWLQTHMHASQDQSRPLVLLVINEDEALAYAAYSGLFLTARQEAPGRLLKIIYYYRDSALSDADLVDLVGAELKITEGPLEVSYTASAQRRVKGFRELELNTADAGPTLEGRVVWITGGLGGLGWEFARHLGTQKHMKIALSGRSPLDEARQARLDTLNELGVELAYFQGDVTQDADVRRIVAAIEQRFGGLNGIIHTAGVVRDALIRDKDLEQLEPVLAPKITGTLFLDQATRHCDLDFIVLCSSLSGVLGNPGQADYAGANAFLDAFAVDRNRRLGQGLVRGRTLAVDWPLWRTGGMSMSPEQERVLQQTTGMTAMPVARGLEALELALRLDQDQILVAHGERKVMSALLLSTELLSAEVPVPHTQVQSGKLATERVQRKLIETVAKLQMVDPQQIELDSELSVYGFDSIRFTELAGRLNEDYGLSLMPTVFFEHRTLRSLSGHLATKYGDAFYAVEPVAQVESDSRLASSESRLASVVSLPVHHRSAGTHDMAPASATLEQPKTQQPSTDTELIAVVGMSGRLPGSVDLKSFWEHLEANADLITEVPAQRWDWRQIYGDPHEEPGKTRAKWGGFIDDVDCFDAMFFGISPSEAQSMDPQSRLFLETAWAAIEDAGYRASDLAGSRTGLFAGVSTTDYRDLSQQAAITEGLVADRSTYAFMLANRVSNFLDIHGPSEAIDTACSSSLVVIHRAVESIRQGSCDAALAGGVNLIANPQVVITASRAGMLSDDGRCKTFDKRANGYVRGEGVGVVLLKPLGRALADGDRIHGLIRGWAVNHGGRATSPSAPNPVAQRALLVDAYSRAGISPDSVSYMEAHGTGTELGDPIELNSLNAAFNELYERAGLSMKRASCALGSVKANIGHLEAAAGISGVLKILMMLRHRKIPGNPHLKEPNPYLQLDDGPFYLAQGTQPWESATPRRAGISSFGIGGTNAHLILEEYVCEDAKSRRLPVGPASPALIVLSARNGNQLQLMARNLREFLRVSEAIDMSELAYTLQVGREAMDERLACIVDSAHSLCSVLDLFLDGANDGHAKADGKRFRDCFFRGSVKREDGPLSLDSLDEDLAKVVESWWSKGKYAELLKLWVKGLAFDWRSIYSDRPPSRISLPSYPFARNRYWIPVGEQKRGQARGEQRVNGQHKTGESSLARIEIAQSWLHPLLHTNTSTLSMQRFSTYLNPEAFYLRDHQVRGQRLLPGVAYLEMIRAAMHMSLDEVEGDTATSQALSIRISNLVWVQALAVGKVPKQVHVSLVQESGASVQCAIYTQESSQQRVHAQAAVALVSPPVSETLDLEVLKARCQRAYIDAEACYAAFKDGGIEYGPGHKTIQWLHVGDGEVLAKLQLPQSLNATEDDYVLHPSLMDGALQSAAQLMFGTDAAQAAGPFLPYALELLELHQPCVASMWARVRDSEGGTHESASTLRKLDIDLCDEQGVLCVRLKGFSSRALDAMKASAKAGTQTPAAKTAETADIQLLLSQPVWRGLPPSTRAQPNVLEHLVLLCSMEQWAPVEVESLWIGVSCSRLESEFEMMHERFEDLAVQVFELVKEALQGGPHRSAFIQLVVPSQGEMQVLRALSGILKTAQREHPRLSGQLVEVSPQLTQEGLVDALKLAAEHSEQAHVRFSADGTKAETEIWDVLPVTAPGALPWKQGGLYLITGGAGALGLILAREICARADNVRLVLVGRSELSNAQLAKVKALGGQVEYRRVDLANSEEFDGLLVALGEEFGGLNGVIHAAGTSRDAFILKKSSEDFAAVMASKVSGAVNLDRACGQMALDFFVLFSSGAAVLGNPGQSDYATANAFLDAFAEYRNQRVDAGERCGRTVSIAWPLWEEGGMAVDEATRQMLWQNQGLVSLSTHDGIAAFYRALDTGLARVLVAHGDVQHLRADSRTASEKTQFGPRSEPNLESKVERTAKAPVSTAQLNKELNNKELNHKTLDFVREALSAVIKMPPQDIETDVAFEKYGLDSIAQMGVIRDLEKVTGELPKTLLFEYPSVDEVIPYLMQHHGETLESYFQAARTEAPEVPPVDAVSLEAGLPRSRLKPRTTIQAATQPADRLQSRSDTQTDRASTRTNDTAFDEDIAIIGVAGRYPGAQSLEALWERLRAGESCIRAADWGRWRHSLSTLVLEPEVERAPLYGGFLDEIDRFDYGLFNVPRDQLLQLPTELRLFLEIAWETFEDAGYSQQGLDQLQQRAEQGVGVFVGSMYSQHAWIQPSLREAVLSSNSSDWQIPNRVSHFFNLTGPSIAVNSACSSSLTAIHLACESLKQKSCLMALAGGVNLTLDPSKFEVLNKANILGSGSLSRSLGDGDGYLPGEGVGAVLLKPLSAALRDGDRIHALIKSSYVNHGGGRQVYTAPDPNQIATLMRQSIRRSGLDPDTIGYIESAVNGSALGDPIEVRALKKAFFECTRRRPLGSVKSNLGHLEAASGISQLSKVLLQIRHQTLVPSINAQPLNPHVNLDDSPFFVQEETTDWAALTDERSGATLPRRSMINSLGVGGAYANLIVEEFIPPQASDRDPVALELDMTGPGLLVFSANTGEQLRAVLANMHRYAVAHPQRAPEQIARSLHRLNHKLPFRAALFAESYDGLLSALKQLMSEDDPTGRLVSSASPANAELTALVGQWVAGKRADFSPWYGFNYGGTQTWMPIPRYPFDHREVLDFDSLAPATPTDPKDPPATAPDQPAVAVQTPAATQKKQPDTGEDFALDLAQHIREGEMSEAQFKDLIFSSLGELR